ncbi:MAG: NADH-quinone oxidoreductase subunit NuoN [Alphaproteobacteria bacterium]|nr:NADH-quinone oxidoreductase subunit NuoN [Alphaproteobacteria bacterium]
MNSPLALVVLAPELLMAVAAMLLLMLGVFGGNKSARLVGVLAVAVMLAAACIVSQMEGMRYVVFNSMFVHDSFAKFVKVVVLVGAALAVMLSWGYNERARIAQPEYPVLIMLATLGMMLMVSANDMLALYVGLELQSLALYVLAAFKRDDARAAEAGLKYFVLGALSSGVLLYGVSLIYGFTGTTNFDVLRSVVGEETAPQMAVIFGLVFIVAGLAFKIAAVPFHMWTPDVYEGSPTPVTAFFAAAPKVAATALLVRVLMEPFAGMAGQWQQIVVFASIASMIIGSFTAIWQTNIKRLMAYSSIGHIGFALVGLAPGTIEGVQGVLIYMAVYFINSLGAFGVILCLRHKGQMIEKIEDLAGLSKSRPMLALAMVIFMFSLAGVPPLAGFFGKFFVFMPAIEAGMYQLAIIGVLMSAVSAYYYLRIIKLMYFDEAKVAIDPVPEFSLRAVLSVSAFYIMLFCFAPVPIINAAQRAAASLLAAQ